MATACAAPARCWCSATTATTSSSACSPPVSPGHGCGGRRWTGSAMPATWWSPMPEHRRLALLLLPLLAALCGFGPLPEDQARLRQAIEALQPQRPGVPDLYVLAVAGDGSEQVFRNEVLHLRALAGRDRKSTRLNSSHVKISYAVFC